MPEEESSHDLTTRREERSSAAKEARPQETIDEWRQSLSSHIDAAAEATRENLGAAVHATADLIEDNLRLFRTSCLAAMAVSFTGLGYFAWRRGVRGFGSVSEIPTSLFDRRAAVKAKFAAAVRFTPEIGPKKEEVFLLAEHYTPARRLLRLVGWPERDWQPLRDASVGAALAWDTAAAAVTSPPAAIGLLVNGHSQPGLLALRLFGVQIEPAGVRWLQEQLPKTARFIDVELLCSQRLPLRAAALPTALGSAAPAYSTPNVQKNDLLELPPTLAGPISEFGRTELVAVCRAHVRVGLLRRKRDVAEILVSEGLGRARDEEQEAARTLNDANDDGNSPGAAPIGNDLRGDEGVGNGEVRRGMARFRGDLERLRRAERRAQEAGKGIWHAETEQVHGTLGTARHLFRLVKGLISAWQSRFAG